MIDPELVTRKILLITRDLTAFEPIAHRGQPIFLAGLRNRIVHEYDELDPKKIFEAVQASLRDIPEYLRQVNAFASRSDK